MATEVRLPQWSMGMSEGTVVTWRCKVGDVVAVDDPLVEVEAEKTTDDVAAPVAGTILQIIVQAGETVPVRSVLALIGEPGEAIPGGGAPAASPPLAAEAAEREGAPTPADGTAVTQIQATPVARKVAKDLGVDINAVAGTGPRGRITEEDVRRHAAGATTATSDAPASTAPAVPPAGATSPAGASTVQLTGMRGAIAARMHTSLHSMAQLTLSRQVDVTEMIALQNRVKAGGGTASIGDFVLKAVIVALTRHPRLNATLENDVITHHAQVDLGVAVALDDGLIVPVVRDARSKRMTELSAEVRDLAQRARTGQAKPAEVSGSTFTVTNLGAHGIDVFTPIINPPEVAILGVGRATETLTRRGNDLAWRQLMTFSLTVDHRAVDGAPGAQFLQTLADVLAEPEALLDA